MWRLRETPRGLGRRLRTGFGEESGWGRGAQVAGEGFTGSRSHRLEAAGTQVDGEGHRDGCVGAEEGVQLVGQSHSSRGRATGY